MQLRRSDAARLARLGNDLAALDGFATLHQHFTGVGISGDVPVRVANQNEVAVALELVAGIVDDAVLGRLTGVPSGTDRLMPSFTLPLVLAP